MAFEKKIAATWPGSVHAFPVETPPPPREAELLSPAGGQALLCCAGKARASPI